MSQRNVNHQPPFPYEYAEAMLLERERRAKAT